MAHGYVAVGKVSKPLGLTGTLIVKLGEGYEHCLYPSLSVWIVPPELDFEREGQVLSVEQNEGEAYAQVTLSNVDGPHAAETRGKTILVREEDLPLTRAGKPMLVTYKDWEVRDIGGRSLGTVTRTHDDTPQMRVDVENDEGVLSIPWVDDIVLSAEFGLVTVKLPEGLEALRIKGEDS